MKDREVVREDSDCAPVKGMNVAGERLNPEPMVSVTPRDGHFELLTLRQDFASESERDHLQAGCNVQTIQESPCTITVKLGKQSRRLLFPFPIDGSHSRTRIARKQLWVEVVVPISLAPHPNGYALRPFPVVSERGQSVAWGMGRINPARSPIMANMALKDMSGFLAMTLSTRENEARSESSQGMAFSRSLFEMKESLAVLFTSFASRDNSAGRQWRGFRLAVQNDSDTLILANSLRHDRDSGSICLDAHVVPLTSHRIQRLSQELVNTLRDDQILSIRVSEQEEILWKHVMPAFAERRRYSWQHKPTCEYVTPKLNCPRSILHGQVAICSCGEGQDVTNIPREFFGFSQLATRIAITPLSAIPIVERMELDSVFSSSGNHLSSPSHGRQIKPPKEQKDRCGCCEKAESNLKGCAGCGSMRYCNKVCQRLAWRTHKLECRNKKAPIQRTRPAA